ncbi:unnamed protein product [Clonostachys rosea]|uniref:VOC domain-containing protein n=1 Tax=Bionectria ochroleuca TaxID=29856 RepID=A0ABY6UPY9_BIOOC|nr:unnamed protein product [Clonostachys rosea]
MESAAIIPHHQTTSFLGKVVEICIVSLDCRKTIAELSKLGIGPFRMFEFNSETVSDRQYRGQAGDFELLVAFATYGDIAWEIMQPVTGSSLMREFLDTRGEGIHHVAFDCHNVSPQQRKEEFQKRGYKVAQSGIWRGRKEDWEDPEQAK